METYRPQNACEDCGYSWHPRGKDLSLKCPSCSSTNVVIVYPTYEEQSSSKIGCFIVLALVAAIIWFLYSSSVRAINSFSHFVQEITTSSVKTESNSLAKVIPKEGSSNAKERPIAIKKQYTDEEIFNLEKQNQYHGNDPIVRSRLGLPDRNPTMTDHVNLTAPQSDRQSDWITKLENEKQYHGDDPVVRERLGLPPKN
jgi:hypothetical protein